MKINKFEDIQAWQEARSLVKMVYSIAELNKQFNSDIRFRSQMTSAAVSIMSNIAEGFSRNSRKEFIRFLFIAKSSAAEVQSQLYIALDLNYIQKKDFTKIFESLDKTARLISKFISYLKNSVNLKDVENTVNS